MAKEPTGCCPECGYEEVEYVAHEPVPQNGEVGHQVACGQCGYRWQEVYAFSHLEDLDARRIMPRGADTPESVRRNEAVADALYEFWATVASRYPEVTEEHGVNDYEPLARAATAAVQSWLENNLPRTERKLAVFDVRGDMLWHGPEKQVGDASAALGWGCFDTASLKVGESVWSCDEGAMRVLITVVAG